MTLCQILLECMCSLLFSIFEPPHGKTNNLHRRKQRRRSAPLFSLLGKLVDGILVDGILVDGRLVDDIHVLVDGIINQNYLKIKHQIQIQI